MELYFDVMSIISRGIDKPTQIMYNTNMSWVNLQDIINALINGGFLTEEKRLHSKRYYVTEKGRNALSYHLKSLEGLSAIEEIFSK